MPFRTRELGGPTCAWTRTGGPVVNFTSCPALIADLPSMCTVSVASACIRGRAATAIGVPADDTSQGRDEDDVRDDPST